MQRRSRSGTVVGSVVVTAFMVFVLASSAVASAAVAPESGASQTVWAYGYVKTVSVGPLTASDGWVYQGTATVGYSVILNQTNTSSTTFELSVARTMGVLFSLEFCYPSCSSPTEYANLSYHAWEVTDSWANFTTHGTVMEAGGPVMAIALLNTNSTVLANLTETTHSALLPVGITAVGGLVERSKYLSAQVLSASNVSFSSPLGLFPESLSGAQSWSSMSTFNASGGGHYSYYYHFAGPIVKQTVGPVAGAFNVTRTGNVTVEGSYSPQDIAKFGGVTYPALKLTSIGPFSVREGFILLPSAADLFGGSSGPWTSVENGSSSVTMSTLDAQATTGGHVGIVASSWLYSLSATNSADADLAIAGGLTPAASSAANPVAATTVQGSPETVPAAQANDQCLTAGSGCPAVASTSPARALFSFVVAAGVGTAVVLLVAVVVVSERRRVPPPIRPNADLYPPMAPGTGPFPSRAGPGESPPPPAEEDPLDHLW